VAEPVDPATSQFGIPADRKADAEAQQPAAFSSGAEEADWEVRDFLARLGHSFLILPFVVLRQSFGELVLASDSHDLSESAWLGFAQSLALHLAQTVAVDQSLKRLAASEGRSGALTEQPNDAMLILDPMASAPAAAELQSPAFLFGAGLLPDFKLGGPRELQIRLLGGSLCSRPAFLLAFRLPGAHDRSGKRRARAGLERPTPQSATRSVPQAYPCIGSERGKCYDNVNPPCGAGTHLRLCRRIPPRRGCSQGP
jgi:hypothetical protein